ncbi:hypothetical protein [Palleronia pelagia]|uniref:hypothetical protein n=1 Tax=Palleronia pelagia TaxID=387096 RepID=UPI0011133566|nr:hypothetical protein [Palleronia pelagia]
MSRFEFSSFDRDTADRKRDEKKRVESPGSFFYAQGRGLLLAADYFKDGRLAEDARTGTAIKHRQRINLAIFGQLMASFEYFLKDFVAKAIDATVHLDSSVDKCDWMTIDKPKVLATRGNTSSVGAMLVHSSSRWHSPTVVNDRYQQLFQRRPISNAETEDLEKLWIARHSVAHNAGFVTHYDASRMGEQRLSEQSIAMTIKFLEETFQFLVEIVRRTTEDIGQKILEDWLGTLADIGPDYARDKSTYRKLKLLSTFVESRPQDLPKVTESQYLQDFPEGQPNLI